MTVAWHIDIGAVINLLALLLIAFNATRRLGEIETKINTLWGWFKKEHNIT